MNPPQGFRNARVGKASQKPRRQVFASSRPQRFDQTRKHEIAAESAFVQPGYGPNTRFSQNTALRVEDLIPEAYAPFAAPIFAEFAKPALFTRETDVAAALWLAANDTSDRLRYPAGPDAEALARAG